MRRSPKSGLRSAWSRTLKSLPFAAIPSSSWYIVIFLLFGHRYIVIFLLALMSPTARRSVARTDENTPLLSDPSQTGAAPRQAQETSLSDVSNAAPSNVTARQVAPDLLRGLLMALMALDHTSVSLGAYAHGTGTVSEDTSTRITSWSPPLPYTLRTLTHLCAGGFAMLMGLGLVYFVESRKRQDWKIPALMRHFLTRTIAILLVNTLSCHLLLSLTSHAFFWLFNIVLPALAVDYLVVGIFYVGVVYYLEPALVSLLQGSTTGGDEQQRESRHQAATKWANRVVNVGLMALSAVVLWANVWSSPHHGECINPTSAGINAVSSQVSPAPSNIEATIQSLLVSSNTSSDEVSTLMTVDYCTSTGRLIYGLLFQSVACVDKGIISGFPPVGWLSFVIFGLVYGRLLLATTTSKESSSQRSTPATRTVLLNLVFAIFFTALFVSTRLLSYGNLSTHCLSTPDQSHASLGKNQYLASWRSFLYIVKYPPSPAYGFFSLAGNFLFLTITSSILASSSSGVVSPIRSHLQNQNNVLLVFGNNPLFFYGVHFYILNLFGLLLPLLPFESFKPRPTPGWPGGSVKMKMQIGLGWSFGIVYATLLVAMYFICKAYGQWKKTKGKESVWRFL